MGAAERAEFQNMRCVSRQWRTVAFSTPSLWHSICIHLRLDLLKSAGLTSRVAYRRILTPWFARAGKDAPLQLSVGPMGQVSVMDLLGITQEFSLPVRDLKLDNPPDDDYFNNWKWEELVQLSVMSSPLPSIKLISICLPRQAPEDELSSSFLDLTTSFPGLQSLGMESRNYWNQHNYTPFVHKTIQHLLLCELNHTSRQIVDLLRELPTLQTLYLYSCYDSFDRGNEEGEHEVYSEAGCLLGELTGRSLIPTIVSFLGTHPKSMLHSFLNHCTNVRALYISRFSDMDPRHPYTIRYYYSDATFAPLFKIPPSLEFVQCKEEGPESVLWSWFAMIGRYLLPGHKFTAQAPNCVKSRCIYEVERYIPMDIEEVEDVRGRHLLTYRHGGIRTAKFIFWFQPPKSCWSMKRYYRHLEKAYSAVYCAQYSR
ncbi:hypothetical protein BKA70DRAFT_1562399 [Coprinopsis sp. MPI-PUGE-AT-0042]|nr:hypothetical protein BKA70DRAFT_1562399 [Coprinopsis sp. MPI-PUGE-AT-0042]